MNFKFLGRCNPGRLFGRCKPPLKPRELTALLEALPMFKAQGFYSTVALSESSEPLPEISIKTAVQYFAHPDNAKMGLLHPHGFAAFFIRIEALEKVVTSGQFKYGQSYRAFVRVLTNLGYVAWDVQFEG